MAQQNLTPYADQAFQEDALAYVYIAQYVRSDGPSRAGVLETPDCQRYYGQLKELVSKGEVQRARWRDLEGFITTTQGGTHARQTVLKRLASHAERVGRELSQIPRQLLQYILQDVILADGVSVGEEGRAVRPDIGPWRENLPPLSPRPTYWCLLTDRDVIGRRDSLFQLLQTMGLMVTAYDYVSTRGGELREFRYVPACELQTFCRDYLVRAGLAGNLWPPEMEEMHLVFHLLDSRKGPLPIQAQLDQTVPVRYRESVSDFISECLAKGVLTESADSTGAPYFKANDTVWYENERARRYRKPLVDFLVGHVAPTPPPSPPPGSLGVSLALTPSAVVSGEDVLARVHVRDDVDTAVAGSRVVLSWGDGKADSTGVCDDQGVYSARHAYGSVGTHRAVAGASKAGFSPGKDERQVTVDMPSPVTFRITFPPYDDGRSLVFGRGPLHGKVAIGFRAGSSFAEEDIVECDLTDVNSVHIGIFMQTRGGKSTVGASLMLQAAFQGIPVVIIDPKPDYTSCLLPLDVAAHVSFGFQLGAQRRFDLARQDQSGFDLSKDLEFTDSGTTHRLRFQVVTFNHERASLPGTRSYRAPLVVLPSLDDHSLTEQCDGLATALASQVMARPEEGGYNALLARALEKIRHDSPTRPYALIDDVIAAVQTVAASGFGKRDVERVAKALLGYKTKTSRFFAAQDKDVSDIADLMAVSRDAKGRVTVPITVVDVSELSPPLGKQKASPQREFISQLCGQIYHWLRSHRGGGAVEVLLVLDEAQNYLPNPADQYNYIRKLIHEGANMGVKVVLLAQNPQQVDMGVRQQLKTFVVARIPEGTVRYVVETMPLPEDWGNKLTSAEEGQALVIDERSSRVGGVLCNLFTSPQFVGFLSPSQVKRALDTH